MSNQNGNAYGLTTLCPIRNGSLSVATEGCPAEASFSAVTRYRLQNLGVAEQSPMARVPNTYLCRFYVLDDVMYQGTPAQYDTLKSSYLVFTSNFHGKLEPWLQGMWNAATGKYKGSGLNSKRIAVGTAVTSGPPHRSVHEELPHTAPTLSRARKRSLGYG